MDNNQILQDIKAAEEFFKTVMRTYWEYFDFLETLAKQIPETEVETLQEIYAHIQEVYAALEHDIAVFDKAVNQDSESLKKFDENLEINSIREQLQLKQ